MGTQPWEQELGVRKGEREDHMESVIFKQYTHVHSQKSFVHMHTHTHTHTCVHAHALRWQYASNNKFPSNM